MSNWPIVPLAEVLRHRKQFIEIDDLQPYKRCRVQLHAQGIVLRDNVPGSEIKTKRQQVCRAGDFLVAEIDAKLGGFGIVPTNLQGAIVSSHYFLYEVAEERMERSFLDYFIRTSGFRDQVNAQGSTNYAAIRPQDVLRYTIPLPPLDVQRRLVLKLDELAAKIGIAVTLRGEANLKSKTLMSSILGQDFQRLAISYEPKPLASLATCITDGPHITPTYVANGIPFVTVKNMVRGTLDFRNLQYITTQDHLDISKRCKPERGDVLYSKDGATRGFPCYVDTDLDFNIFVSVALIKPKRDTLDGQYLTYLLNSQWIKDRVLDRTRGDMIPHIVLREIRAFPVPCPPLEEQLDIVAEFDKLRGGYRRLLQTQKEADQAINAMLPSILNQAFQGQLS